jgi:SAM-dependent methyltransferase
MAETPTVDRDYVLGTRDQETLRLGFQHEAWAPIAHECWIRSGISEGDRVIDVGAGPGYAAFDLARLVGDRGHVTAVERSSRFVEAGRAMARGRGAANVEFVELDLMTDALPPGQYDAAWCRWVCSFVDSPVVLLRKVAAAVVPGGVAMFHEYVDYASWRFSPSLPLVEEYIGLVMQSWREAGGEPDVATSIPPILALHGFEIERVEPRVYCVRPADPMWSWISTFVESNLSRLVELETCGADWARAVRTEFRAAQADPETLMITPMVLEVVARRKSV